MFNAKYPTLINQVISDTLKAMTFIDRYERLINTVEEAFKKIETELIAIPFGVSESNHKQLMDKRQKSIASFLDGITRTIGGEPDWGFNYYDTDGIVALFQKKMSVMLLTDKKITFNDIITFINDVYFGAFKTITMSVTYIRGMRSSNDNNDVEYILCARTIITSICATTSRSLIVSNLDDKPITKTNNEYTHLSISELLYKWLETYVTHIDRLIEADITEPVTLNAAAIQSTYKTLLVSKKSEA